MNEEGLHKWKGYAVEEAIAQKKVKVQEEKVMLEVALGLGGKRAKLALQLLLASILGV